MADAVVQAEVGKEGKGPAGMTYLAYTGWITHFCPVFQEELRITVHFKRTLGLPCRISYEQKHDVVALNRKKNARSICTRR